MSSLIDIDSAPLMSQESITESPSFIGFADALNEDILGPPFPNSPRSIS